MTRILLTQLEPAADGVLQQQLLTYGLQAELCPPNGQRLLQQLQLQPCSAVILRQQLVDLTPAALLLQYRLQKRGELCVPQLPPPEALFFALLPGLDAQQRRALLDVGYAAVLPPPVSEYKLAAKLLEQMEICTRRFRSQQEELRASCAGLLRQLGMPCALKGFSYFVECLVYLASDPDALYQVTKVLYPRVAQSKGTSASNLERSMRTALDHMLQQGGRQRLASLLPPCRAAAIGRGGRLCISELLGLLSQCPDLRRQA